MDKLTRLRHYTAGYYQHATQHRTSRAARAWMEADVPADVAGAWASLGYLYVEAAPLIAAGVTPEMAAEMEEIAEIAEGGAAERAARMIDRLVAEGVLVDPALVKRLPPSPEH